VYILQNLILLFPTTSPIYLILYYIQQAALKLSEGIIIYVRAKSYYEILQLTLQLEEISWLKQRIE
jgi:hypothetical protein